MKTIPAIGWIRGDQVTANTEATNEILKLKNEIDNLNKRLKRYSSAENAPKLSQGEEEIPINYLFQSRNSSHTSAL